MAARTGPSDSDLAEIIGLLAGTPRGEEPSMYPRIAEIFTKYLGHSRDAVKTDTRLNSGGRPDVAVSPTDSTGIAVPNWIVLEAKDERSVFANIASAQPIITEKWKYVGLETGFFVFIDPECVRIRPVLSPGSETDASHDIVVSLSSLTTRTNLAKSFGDLEARQLGNEKRLKAFRDGDSSTFAYLKVYNDPKIRGYLASALTEAVDLLRQGVRAAWLDLERSIAEVKMLLNTFIATHGDIEYLGDIRIRARSVQNITSIATYRTDLNTLTRRLRRNEQTRAAFRIVTEALPRALERIPNKAPSPGAKAVELLQEETVALLLSRILLLRFFEDHAFFGPKRYLCNGGLKSLSFSMEYFKDTYARVLRRAYEAGSELYSDVFQTDALDWVLSSTSEYFSKRIERVLYLLAAFDFSTVREEILTIVYASFFSEHQRKTQGEHYTPPTIASWILRRINDEIGLTQNSRIFDPACGLGTFVVEAFRAGIGAYLGRGGTVDSVDFQAVAGADLNAVSAAFARMQLLWTILEAVSSQPFPAVAIVGGQDSISVTSMTDIVSNDDISPFLEIDQSTYDAVVGNPPYVRPERRTFAPTEAQKRFFAPFSVDTNIYVLFVLKALRSWLRGNGMLGFVIPKSFLTASEGESIRRLFAIGGEYRIVEIVDLEDVAKSVFSDAAVIPIVFIAQKRPATSADRITLRVVSDREVTPRRAGRVAEFNLDKADVWTVPYDLAFSTDGRILNRITEARSALVTNILSFGRFEEIAAPRTGRPANTPEVRTAIGDVEK